MALVQAFCSCHLCAMWLTPDTHGIFSIGVISMGVFSAGLVSMGVLVAGAVSMGIVALGPSSMGLMQHESHDMEMMDMSKKTPKESEVNHSEMNH